MAIYSLNHKAIGKGTQDKPFTASAHVRYVTRASACTRVMGKRMPINSKQAQSWLKKEERQDRKNSRICDKVMIALPRELDAKQRQELIEEFADIVTQGRAPWIAAMHDKGKDKNNPHCHLIIRDRDPETGRRVLYMSAGKKERGQLAKRGISAMHTERMRKMWEESSNEHLERAGHAERIDCRTLAAQGVDREPTLHEGVRGRQMVTRGQRPQSKVVQFPNAVTAQAKRRSVDFRVIDGGKTRQEENLERKQRTKLLGFVRDRSSRDDDARTR